MHCKAIKTSEGYAQADCYGRAAGRMGLRPVGMLSGVCGSSSASQTPDNTDIPGCLATPTMLSLASSRCGSMQDCCKLPPVKY